MTRNNSIDDNLKEIISDDMKMMEHNSDQLKYTCTECDYKITNHASIDKHVGSIHGIKEVDIVYVDCKHVFNQETDYNIHFKEYTSLNINAEVSIKLLDDNRNISY